jgi:hypothetical protein
MLNCVMNQNQMGFLDNGRLGNDKNVSMCPRYAVHGWQEVIKERLQYRMSISTFTRKTCL